MWKAILKRTVGTLVIIHLLVATLILLNTGCAPKAVYVKPAPPHAKREVVPPRPNGRAVWMNGHWEWAGRHYVWVAGHWELRPKGSAWVPGHWRRTPHGWKWARGRWVK
jgi:hypothetical protein